MSEELLAVLRKIVSQCPESMLKAVGGGYVIKDIYNKILVIRKFCIN